jgi:hypothetical protein
MGKLSSFFQLVKLFWNRSDELVRLLTVLDSQLPNVGQALEGAGSMAILTGQTIDGGSGAPPGAAQAIEAAAAAIDDCGKKLKDVPAAIDSVRQKLHDVNVASVTIQNKDYSVLGGVGKVTVPTPVKSDWYPFRDIEEYLATQGNLVRDAAARLDTTQQELHRLSDQMANAGSQIKEVGTDLKEAGRLLKEIG